MLKLLTNVEGRHFILTDNYERAKLLSGSKGFITSVSTVSVAEGSKPCQAVNTIIYRLGKSGKYRLKYTKIYLPILDSDNSKIREIVSSKTPVQFLSEECVDVRKYKTEEFIVWALSRLLQVRGYTRSLLNGVFPKPSEVRDYIKSHHEWSLYTHNAIVQDLLGLFDAACGNIINKKTQIISAFDDPERKEAMIDIILGLKSLSTTLRLYSEGQRLSDTVIALGICRESALKQMYKRGYEKKKAIPVKVTLDKKYEWYDVVVNELYRICKQLTMKRDHYHFDMIPFRMNN